MLISVSDTRIHASPSGVTLGLQNHCEENEAKKQADEGKTIHLKINNVKEKPYA
jgi:hypothetical protein